MKHKWNFQYDKSCYCCGKPYDLHRHHIFEGRNRKKSEEWGLTIWLCGAHHNLSNEGIHFNKDLDLQVKQMAQEAFEEAYGHDKFMEEFGRNYLWD